MVLDFVPVKTETVVNIRPIDPTSEMEVTKVARCMQLTLVEVLGEAQGLSMYPVDWLEQRVRWHLNTDEVTGQVFVAQTSTDEIIGHTIVRIDSDDEGNSIGLFSTTYIDPEWRNRGVASQLIGQGEGWMEQHQMTRFVTYTDKNNTKLQRLFSRHGYDLSPMDRDFVMLSKQILAHE